MQSANIIFEELKPFIGSYLEFELFCMQNFEHTYDEVLLRFHVVRRYKSNNFPS